MKIKTTKPTLPKPECKTGCCGDACKDKAKPTTKTCPTCKGKGVIMALLALSLFMAAGCNTVSDKQAELAAQTANNYYNQPKVAQLWCIESDGTNTCTFTVSGFKKFEMNTPVPPVSIMPKDPTSLAIIGDVVKTAVPYAAGAYLLKGTIGNGSSSSTSVKTTTTTAQ
jgi:hypothetical protein